MNYYNEDKRTRMYDPLTQFSTWVTRVWAGSTNCDVTHVGGAQISGRSQAGSKADCVSNCGRFVRLFFSYILQR